MIDVYLFRVFVDAGGNHGTPHSLVIDEAHGLTDSQRMAIPKKLGHDETVYVNDLGKTSVSLYHPLGEVDFAGSALIGAVSQLTQITGKPLGVIRCKRGDIKTWQTDDIFWLEASLENNIGNWDYEHLRSPEEVESIEISDTQGWKKMVWAWIDQERGLIRARTFASKIDIPEVQGNGSGSMNLAGQLRRSIEILHGDGSVIYAKPLAAGYAALGGRVIIGEPIPYPL